MARLAGVPDIIDPTTAVKVNGALLPENEQDASAVVENYAAEVQAAITSLAEESLAARTSGGGIVVTNPPGSLTPVPANDTDGTAQIEAIRSYCVNTLGRPPLLIFPPGNYRTTAPIVPVRGERWGSTYIGRLTTQGSFNGQPIITSTDHTFRAPTHETVDWSGNGWVDDFHCQGLQFNIGATKRFIDPVDGRLWSYGSMRGCTLLKTPGGDGVLMNIGIQGCDIEQNMFHGIIGWPSGTDNRIIGNYGDHNALTAGDYLWYLTIQRSTLERNFLTARNGGCLRWTGGDGNQVLSNQFDGYGNPTNGEETTFQPEPTQDVSVWLEAVRLMAFKDNVIANAVRGTTPTFETAVMLAGVTGVNIEGTQFRNVGNRSETANTRYTWGLSDTCTNVDIDRTKTLFAQERIRQIASPTLTNVRKDGVAV